MATTPTFQRATAAVADVAIQFQNADLSADDYSNFIEVPREAKGACIHIGCTATGTPIGLLKIKVTGNANDTVANADEFAYQPESNPTGAAWRASLELETSARYIALFWDRTSGGTGAVWNSGVTGESPFITFIL